jgi:predicted RND superfamily exporter protein
MSLKEKIIDLQIKKPKLFVILTIILTLISLGGYFNILNNLQPSVEKLLPQQTEVVKNINFLRDYYDIDAIQLVIKSDQDLRDPLVLKFFDQLKGYLKTLPHISKVQTPADIVKEYYKIIPEEKEKIRKITSLDPRFHYFYSYDYSLAVIYIYTDLGANTWLTLKTLNQIRDNIKNLEKKFPYKLEYYLTGFPALNIDLFFSIIFDFIKISIIAFAIILLILIIKFRNFKEVLLVISVIFFPLIWTTGIIGYLGLELTIVSTVYAAMLMALGISYGINFYNTYLQEKERFKNKEKALRETSNMLMTALVGSSLTTIASFIALLAGIVPSYRSLGIILAIGIFLVLFYTLIIFPAFVSIKEKIYIGK